MQKRRFVRLPSSLLESLLLEDDGVAGFDAGEDLGLGAVGDASLDIDLAAALLLAGVGDFDGGVAILVVDDGLLGDGEDALVLFEEDLGVGGHVGFELAARVVDGDADLKGGDFVLLDAEGGDAGDFAEEGLVLEGLDLDARGLAEVDLADVGLVDLALDVDVLDVADGHDEGGGGAHDEDGADRVTELDVAGEDDAIHGRGDGGVAELLLELLEGGLRLLDLSLGLVEFGGVDGDLGDGLVAGVGGEEVFLLGVVEGLLGDYAILGHLEGAVVGVLVHGEVGGLGVDLVVLDGGGGGAGVGLGRGELGALSGYLGEDLDLIELGEELALFDVGVDVGVEAGDDTGGLGFDLDLGDGLNLAGGDYGFGDVTAFGFGQLRAVEFGAAAAGGYRDSEDDGYDQGDEASPDPEFPFVFALCGQGCRSRKFC